MENLKEFLLREEFTNCSNNLYWIKKDHLVLAAFKEDVFEVRDSKDKKLLLSGSQVEIKKFLEEIF